MLPCNPWRSIWGSPRTTFAVILAHNPKESLWILSFIYGFLALLNAFQSALMGRSLSLESLLVLALILGLFWGYLIFGFWSWVVRQTGRLFRGKGTFQEVRAAFAWSCAPLIINVVLWAILIAVFDASLFNGGLQDRLQTTGHSILLVSLLTAKVAVVVWSLVLYVNALAAAQRFSIFRSLCNIVCAWIVVAVMAGIVSLCLMKGIT